MWFTPWFRDSHRWFSPNVKRKLKERTPYLLSTLILVNNITITGNRVVHGLPFNFRLPRFPAIRQEYFMLELPRILGF